MYIIHLHRGLHTPKLMMHIAYSPYFQIFKNSPDFRKIYKSPYFRSITVFGLIDVFVSPIFKNDAFMHHALHVGLLDAPTSAQTEAYIYI